jgi:formate hydrogenlyase subunit 3/multisubunit Na+/H+ antiporter MnhD subunit
LVAWEVMALASYFLVVFDDELEEVRNAGRTYLIASHLGTAFLFVFFILLGRQANSLDFEGIERWIAATGGFAPAMAGTLFLLAIIGFGTKAGFAPLHVWLPEAHPAAPSHVSAVMSGVMIKTGIYGVMRTISFLGEPPAWWGWLLISIGVLSCLAGVVYAVVQSDMKRLLAYSSVENIGIIGLGLGIGLLGITLDEPAVAALGFAGALFHVINHCLFKGLLFLAAGAVVHGAHSRNMEELGGLLKRMPLVGTTFLIGCVAICGLPPLNGFVSEFLLYFGAFEAETVSETTGSISALMVIGTLALVGGLAAVAFTKAFGVIFLGAPRTQTAQSARAPGVLMQFPLVVLAAGCVAASLAAVPIARHIEPVLRTLVAHGERATAEKLVATTESLSAIVWAAAALGCVALALAVLRLWLLWGREVGASPTWDCGYARPTARMQYTASSFAQPVMAFFGPLLRTQQRLTKPVGIFPTDASLETDTPDVALDQVYRRSFRGVTWALSWLGWIQNGRVSIYVLYIAVTMVALLVWFVL